MSVRASLGRWKWVALAALAAMGVGLIAVLWAREFHLPDQDSAEIRAARDAVFEEENYISDSGAAHVCNVRVLALETNADQTAATAYVARSCTSYIKKTVGLRGQTSAEEPAIYVLERADPSAGWRVVSRLVPMALDVPSLFPEKAAGAILGDDEEIWSFEGLKDRAAEMLG